MKKILFLCGLLLILGLILVKPPYIKNADAGLVDACYSFTSDSGYQPTRLNTCFSNIRTVLNGQVDSTNAPTLIHSTGDYTINSLAVTSGVNIGLDAGRYGYQQGGIKLINSAGQAVTISANTNATELNVNGNLSVAGYVYSLNSHEKQSRTVAVGPTDGGADTYGDASILGVDGGNYIAYMPIISSTVAGVNDAGGELITVQYQARCGNSTDGGTGTINQTFYDSAEDYLSNAEIQDLVCSNTGLGLRGYFIKAKSSLDPTTATVTTTVTGYVH